MIGLDVSFNGRVQSLYTDATKRQFGLAVARYVQDEIVPASERRMNRQLQQQPGKPKYPIRWASDKQRKYVMAKLRKADNLPYKRTGKLARNWKVVSVTRPTSGEVVMSNPSKIAQYVYGNRVGKNQQPFHKDTGWPLAEPFFVKEYKLTSDQLAGAWPDIVEDVRRNS